ncbi:Serine/threonine-protein kinase bud32 [Stemphylium lycopersici]|nr:Serine/threonine-protein kinase bud32 [Stemphylium lycopersici]
MAEPPIAQPITPPPQPPTSRPLHTLPAPFSHSDLEPITQGAEALVYKTTFLTPHTPVVVKYRPPKPYRHPTLDKRLTKQRLLAEARSLVRCRKEGVNVPGVVGADWEGGWLVLEFVEGRTVRRVLDDWAHGVRAREGARKDDGGSTSIEGVEGKEKEDGILDLMRRVGREVGKLHDLGVCHGDLTTSNIMLRTSEATQNVDDGHEEQVLQQPQPQHQQHDDVPRGKQTPSAMREAAMRGDAPLSPPLPPSSSQPPPTSTSTISPTTTTSPPPTSSSSSSSSLEGTIYLIDFGLTSASIADEDKAVDLYVLERAFSATHPAAEPLFQEVLKAYGETGKDGGKGAKGVLKRLEGVRLRGRKRSMLG